MNKYLCLLASTFILLCRQVSASVITLDGVTWYGFNDYGTMSCPVDGQVVVGFCVRGWPTYGCEVSGTQYDFAIACSDNPTDDIAWTDTTGTVTEEKATLSSWTDACPSDAPIMSGITIDKSSYTLQCEPENTEAVVVDDSSTFTICVNTFSELYYCPYGSVLTRMCIGDCGTDICSGKTTGLGMQCTYVAAYEYIETTSYSGNNDDSTYSIVDCSSHHRDVSTDVEYTMTNTITVDSSVTTTSESSSTSSSTVTDSIKASEKISTDVGLVTGELSLDEEYSVETSFTKSSTYITAQFEGTEKTQEVDQTFTLTGGYVWNVVSFGASIQAYGDYSVVYTKYQPGYGTFPVLGGSVTSTNVTEDVSIVNTDINDSDFILALSSEYYDKDYLKGTSCEDIASDYLTSSGIFVTSRRLQDRRGLLRGGKKD